MVYVFRTPIWYTTRLKYAPYYAMFPNLDLETGIHPSIKLCLDRTVQNHLLTPLCDYFADN